MIPTEKRIASFIKDHFDEHENCLDMQFYRLYADSALFNNAVKDCTFSDCQPTDVLSFEYAKYENGTEFVQMFVSTPEDDGQDWFSFRDLSRRDRLNIVRLFDKMMDASGFELRAPVLAL